MAASPQWGYLECSKLSVPALHWSPTESDGRFRIQVMDRFGVLDQAATLQAAFTHQQTYHPLTGAINGVLQLGLFNIRVGVGSWSLRLGQVSGITQTSLDGTTSTPGEI